MPKPKFEWNDYQTKDINGTIIIKMYALQREKPIILCGKTQMWVIFHVISLTYAPTREREREIRAFT